MSQITIIGNLPTTHRVLTGLWDFDQMLAGHNGTIGMPVLGGLELYGKWETGKSTLAYYLAGCVKPVGKIVLVDLEGGARTDYLIKAVGQSGFEGEIIYVEHEDASKEMRSHESMLEEGANHLHDEEVGCLIVDSMAATRPVAEMKGDLEASYMGRRAQALAKFSRRWGPIVQYMKKDQLVILVNHMLQSFDGFGKISPGGDTPKFWINARLWISRTETFDNGDFTSKVEVEKLRFGGKTPRKKGKDSVRSCEVVFLQGLGISPALSNLWAAMKLGLARRQKGTGMVQYQLGDDWEKIAKLPTIFNRTRKGDTAWVKPIMGLLGGHDN